MRETSYRPVKRGGKGQVVIRLGRLERYELPVLVYAPGSEEEEEVLEGEELETTAEAESTPSPSADPAAAPDADPPASPDADEEPS